MGEKVREVFQRLADQANQLPDEERAELLEVLSEYTHDLKHTLGLVTGANALISRIAENQPQVEEMVEIIVEGTGQLDDLINLMVAELNERIISAE